VPHGRSRVPVGHAKRTTTDEGDRIIETKWTGRASGASAPCSGAKRRLGAFLCLLLIASGATVPTARARGDGDGSAVDVSFGPRRALRETGEYFTAPLRWDRADWLYLGGAIVAIGAAHQFDGRVRTDFTAGSPTALDGKDPHSLQDAIPAAAAVVVTGIYATLIGSNAGRDETWSMLEAGALASTTGFALKYLAGRERPNQTANPNEWRQHGASFPSLHATAAFAIGTVLAESGNDRYRWLRRFLGYGLAAATGYVRLRHNAHWLSDVVAGAALGIASAHFALNREYRSGGSAHWKVLPTRRGVMLSYVVPIH